MSLPDEKELDQKRPTVSPVAVQSSTVTVSHPTKRQDSLVSRDALKLQQNIQLQSSHSENAKTV